MFPDGIDRGLVLEGLPVTPGTWLIWHERSGWPVITIVVVELTEKDGVPTWWVGTGGTDRDFEVPRMVNAARSELVGHSEPSPDAFAYFERLRRETKETVLEMVRKARPE